MEGFHSDFRYVADYFVQMQRTGTYIGSREAMTHVREVLQLMTVLTGDGRFASVTEQAVGEAEKGALNNMCDVLDAIEKKGYDLRTREVAIRMYRKGNDTDYIAEILETDTETILSWLREAGEI